MLCTVHELVLSEYNDLFIKKTMFQLEDTVITKKQQCMKQNTKKFPNLV